MPTPALGDSRVLLCSFLGQLPSGLFWRLNLGLFWHQEYKLTELLEEQLHQQVAVLGSCTNSSASNRKLVHYLSILGMSRMSFLRM